MNHREPPQLSAATRKALHCLSLLLLPSMTPTGAYALPRLRLSATTDRAQTAETLPYLRATGAPPLRFQAAPSATPSAAARLANAATPALAATESAIAQANAAATQALDEKPTLPGVADPTLEKTPATAPTTPATGKTPRPILPDDARPAVHPEDFLPYFQIPGSARQPADVTLLVPVPKAPPAPGTLPPSSATYTQTPK